MTGPLRWKMRQTGLTLVEMLVVVTLLAIAAGVAVTATEGLVEQSRYDATRRALAEIEDSILGANGIRQPDGTPLVTGFVADMGRLPEFVAASDAALQLQELWLKPAGAPDCGLQQPRTTDLATVLDPDVILAAGWRGPYMRLPIGSASLTNGWGHPFRLLAADGSALTADGAPVEIVRSLGADDADGGAAAYDADVDVVLRSTAAPVQAPRHLGTVSGTVTPVSGGGTNVVVRLYGPVDGVVHDLSTPITLSAAGGTQTFTFTNVSVGPRAIRAYQTTTAPAQDQAFADAVTHKSRVVHVVIPRGGYSGIALELQ